MRRTPDAHPVSRRVALRTMRGSAAVGALLAFAPSQVVADADPSGAVVGSWLIRSGPADQPLPITSLITYSAQGTCVQATVNHPRRSPAMGVWTGLGGHEFATTFAAFVFDEAGHFSNVSQVRVQSILDESLESYSGRFEVYTLDENGNAVRLDSSGHVAATRIHLERLEEERPEATRAGRCAPGKIAEATARLLVRA